MIAPNAKMQSNFFLRFSFISEFSRFDLSQQTNEHLNVTNK